MEIKKLTTIILFFFFSFSLLSQGNVNYSLTVKNKAGDPLKDITVKTVETSTLKFVEGTTDENGKLLLELNNGKEWAFTVGEIKNAFKVSAINYKIVDISDEYIFDLAAYKREKKQVFNRTEKGFEINTQKVNEDDEFSPEECMLVLRVKTPKGKFLSSIKVSVVNIKDSLIYKSKTDQNGKACFILPNKNNYDIDIQDLMNYTYHDFGDEYTKYKLDIEYAPTIVDEKVINDTTFQKANASTQPSTDRALMKINVSGGKKGGMNEQIFLRELNTGKVYSTNSNSKGVAYFLVPIKHIYMIDFTNQKNADAVNLMNAREMTKGEVSVRYLPDPRLEYPERFIPTTENLFLKSFNSFLENQFEKPKDKPFVLKIKSAFKINKHSKEALFSLKLASSDSYGRGVRLPSNVALVLDKSGSMFCCGRYESLKKSLWEIGNSFTNDDIVSVVLFDTDSLTVQHSRHNHLDGIERIIDFYRPGGGTFIFDGLKAGVHNVQLSYDKNKSNKVILLTDGYGITPPMEITNYVSQKYQEGIEFSAIGLGDSYNQSLLRLIAEKGFGSFGSVDSSPELSQVFKDQIVGSNYYLVKDLKIDIYHDKELIFSKLFGYPVNQNSEGELSIEIGKLSRNKSQIAFLKFKLNNPTIDIESKPLKVKVSYFDMTKNKNVFYEEEIKLEWTEESDAEMMFDQREKTLYSIAIINQTLKLMAEANGKNDHELAKEVLKQGISQIKEIFPDSKPKEVKKLFDDMENYMNLFNQIEKNK